ncbi:MAG: 50S ribosomal protein L5 [Candidatus Micrarchaeia archaeon]
MPEAKANEDKNPMQDIYLEKVTLNIGIGSSEEKYENAKEILRRLTNHTPTMARAKERKPEFGIKKGQIIGAYVTVRKQEAAELLKRALDAKDNTVKPSSISGNSLNFGIDEYIYFSNMKYDPKIGMFGLNVNASFARKGMRVKRRRRARGSVAKKHETISREELIDYISKRFNTKITEEE